MIGVFVRGLCRAKMWGLTVVTPCSSKPAHLPWYSQWLKFHRTLENAVSPPSTFGSRRFPTSKFLKKKDVLSQLHVDVVLLLRMTAAKSQN